MRYELTDFEWAAIRSFLPNKPRGAVRGRLEGVGQFHDLATGGVRVGIWAVSGKFHCRRSH
jgi:hypothetical protein